MKICNDQSAFHLSAELNDANIFKYFLVDLNMDILALNMNNKTVLEISLQLKNTNCSKITSNYIENLRNLYENESNILKKNEIIYKFKRIEKE